VGASWPLVGRVEELVRAVELCEGGGVLVAGPSGVGKTRLAAEAVDALTATLERPALRVRATDASSKMPLGAFAQVLGARAGATGETGGLVPADADRIGALAAHLTSDLDEGERLLLSVDDVHVLDDTSATLLLQLVLDGRVSVVLTARSDLPLPEPITLLWRDELVGRIDLEPLGPDAVTELLDRVLPGGVDGLSASTLIAASGGNLLYLRELVTGLQDAGTLVESRGHWTLTGPITAPPRLTELIELRLASLGDDARNLLQAVALAEPLGVHGLESKGELHLAQELIDAGVVEVVEDGRRRQMRALHPLHAEVARATTPELLRRHQLDMLAEAIERTGLRRRDDARRLAAWRLDAGRSADPEVLVDAAREARAGSDLAMCERFARGALDTVDLAPELRVAATLQLGLALDAQGRFEEAEAAFAAVEPSAGDGQERLTLALARSANLFRGLGDLAGALAVLDAAEADIADPSLRDELTAQRSSFAWLTGDLDRALELSTPVMLEGSGRAAAEAGLQAAAAHVVAGRSTTSVALARSALEARLRLGDDVQLVTPVTYVVALALALCEEGAIEESIRLAEEHYELAVHGLDRHGQAWMALVRARGHLASGRPATAVRLAREAAVVFGDLRHQSTSWAFGLLALAAGHLGDASAAATAMDDLSTVEASPVRVGQSEVARGRAWALVADGRISAGADVLRVAAEGASARGQVLSEAAALYDLARVGAAIEAVGRLDRFDGVIEGRMFPVQLRHVRALALDDPDQLDAAARDLAALGATLHAAEAATAAAVSHRRRGASRAAAASEQSARRLLRDCEGAATPALATETGVDPLTRREREVAGLAARGRTNREIADELVVSVRTVENHLQRVYAKLGVSSRDDLDRALAGR
jgi:DNA-binding CsgD family transcriptional regulator/tetratricopeptide (TPR) repeat protein